MTVGVGVGVGPVGDGVGVAPVGEGVNVAVAVLSGVGVGGKVGVNSRVIVGVGETVSS